MSSLQRSAADVLYDGETGERFVDLCIELREWGPGAAPILEVGGRWDRADRRWADEAHARVVWNVHPGQYEAAHFFADWFRAYAAGQRVPEWKDVYVMLCAGGRGAGKTDFGSRAAVMVATGISDRIVWCVSPSESETTELQAAIEKFTPDSFYRWLRSELVYYLWNGSRISMMSGYNPGTLKRGRVDYWLLNEAQRFPKEAYKMIRPRLADTGGLGFIAANPPRDPKGRWVMDFYDQAKASKLPGIRLIEFDPLKNPTLDQRGLEVLLPEFGEEDYRREIKGEMLPVGDVVFYAWSDLAEIGNVRPVPDVGECTRAFTKKRLGREFDVAIALDFQLAPHMAGVAGKFYADPSDPERPFSWYTDEIVVSGTEHELCDELEAHGYDPERTALICDASGWWQDAEREKDRASVDILKSRGWKFCFRPQKGSRRNPPIIERILATNARLKATDGVRRAFSVPENMNLNRAMKMWENRNGAPYKRSDFAHLGDCASYFQIRFFPRKQVMRGFKYEGGERIATKMADELDEMV